MNYEPGQKVKVKVNDVEWDDEIDSEYVEQYSKNGKRINITYNQCALKSGICVPVSMLSPIEPEIKPEPGDIGSVWEDDDEGEPDPMRLRMFEEIKDGQYGVKDGDGVGRIEYWSHYRVLARKPKRWEEISEDKQNIIRRSMFIFGHEYIGMPREEAYDKILSIILDGVPYARIDR